MKILLLMLSHLRTKQLQTLHQIVVELQYLVPCLQNLLKELRYLLVLSLDRLDQLSDLLQRRLERVVLDLDEWLVLYQLYEVYEGVVLC